MSEQRTRLVISSSTAHLQAMEEALGEKSQGEHNKGSLRSNGKPLKQSVWIRDCLIDAELLEDVVSELIGWIQIRSAALDAIDSQSVKKIICTLSSRHGQDCFSVNVELARKLYELNVQLLIEIPLANEDRSKIEG